MPRKIVPLNRGWKYINNFKKDYIKTDYPDFEFKDVNLPHANIELPYNCFDEKSYQFVSCYRKTLAFSDTYDGKNVFIDFEGVMSYAKIYLNAHFIGEHKGGYTPFSINLTKHIDFNRENILAVMVDSTERSDIPPFGNLIDYLAYGGIYREVFLRFVEQIYIQNSFTKTKNVLKRKKDLITTVYLRNKMKKKQELVLEISLIKEDTLIAKKEQGIKIEKTDNEDDISFEIELNDLENIELWDIDHPNFYKVKASLYDKNNRELDSLETRIGFRETYIKPDGFYLNGKKMKLIGLNRHQSYPYIGYAMPERAQKKDADILKNELALNTVRTSHYPQSRHFLDRCDEVGLLVLEEIPGWIYVGDSKWKETALQNLMEMIKRDWNHPCIILWGVRINESADNHDFYINANQTAHKLDPSRQTCGVRNFEGSEFLEDVYTMNDFIYDGGEIILREPKKVTGLKNDVPYLVTEFCGHMFPTKRFDQEERLIEHSMRHLKIMNEASIRAGIAGAIGWCAFDYNTHYQFGSGDRICYHGVMDMFRIPKFAAHFYRSQMDPNKEFVLEPLTLWCYGERNKSGLTPLIIFTNCDAVELELEGKWMDRYYPDKKKYPGIEHPPVFIENITGKWGDDLKDSVFKGLINEKVVCTKSFTKNPAAVMLTGKADDLILKSGDYDVTRLVYKIVDRCGNIMPFVNERIRIEIEGPGEIIGPKETALIGGCIATWIKTKGEKGIIRISAFCTRFKAEDIEIEVI